MVGVVRGSPHPPCGHLLSIRRGEGIILWDVFLGQVLAHGHHRTNPGLISVARGLVRFRSLGSHEPSVAPNSFRRFPSGSSQRTKKAAPVAEGRFAFAELILRMPGRGRRGGAVAVHNAAVVY